MNKKDVYELTNPQTSIWNMESFFENTTINNICTTGTIYEKIDLPLLKQAINNVVEKNDSFRIQIHLENNIPYQTVTEFKPFDIEVINVKNESDMKKIEKEAVNYKFNIIGSQLFRFQIVLFENGFGGIILNQNHIISDAWSLSLIIQGIIEEYHALVNHENLPETNNSYIDYIKSEQEYKQSEKCKNDKKFWEETFETIPEQATIPSHKKIKSNSSNKAKRKEFSLDKDLVTKINEFCKKEKLSVFNFLMAIYSIYIGRVSNLDNLVIGTPILNRSNFRDKHTTGMFVNTVPVKIDIPQDNAFVDFAHTLSSTMMSVFKHQKYSYNSILEDLRAKNNNLPNLYNIILSYQIINPFDEKYGKYKSSWTFNNYCGNDFNIHISDANYTGELAFTYDYLIDKYDLSDVKNLHNRIINMINQIMEIENININDLEIVTQEEKDELLYKFNNTYVEYPKEKTIVDLFEEQVEKTPNNTAVVFGNESLTYKELNEKANQLANYLISKNVKIGDTVGILLNRSLEMIIGLIAILKTGAHYLPIDPEYPTERISYMLENSGTNILLVNDTTINIKLEITNKINIQLNKQIYNKMNTKNLNIKFSPNNLIYLIYTSGSTGKPKGVMLTHQNVNNFLTAIKKEIDFSPKKKMVSLTTICFDIFVLECWGSLTNGLKLILANEQEQNNVELLNKLCKKNKVNIIQTTPSRYSAFLEDSNNLEFLKNATDILVGGEPLPKNLLLKFKKSTSANIYNMYGPTETAVWSTIKNLTNTNNITIGFPIANTKCYILDKNQKLLPKYTPGELYIGGDGVSNGYLKRNKLTSEKFIKSPFGNELIYNTNDLAYIDKNGELVHLGRDDSQIKIRGYRVELEEIENKIRSFNGITNCAVIYNSNSKKIIAYYTEKKKISTDNLRSYLMNQLPFYMIPADFIVLDTIPYTPNGKVDKNSLKNLNISPVGKELILPQTDVEKKIYDIISNILGNNEFGITDDFFSIGMDSLNIIKLASILQKEFNIEFSSSELYKLLTVEGIANYIADNSTNIDDNLKMEKFTNSEFYPLSRGQKRIYYASKISNNPLVYNICGGLLVDKLLDKEKINKIFKELIQNHSSFRTCFKIIDNEPKQIILDSVSLNIKYYKKTNANINKLINSFPKEFDFENAPLIRVEVNYINNQKTLLLIDSHHIILDGTSLDILMNEFCKLYNGESIESEKIEYKDFTLWENKFEKSNRIKDIEKEWLKTFKNVDIPTINLPYDFPVTNVRTFNGDTIRTQIPEDILKNVKEISKKYKVSPYVLFLSVFYVLLYRYTGQETIIVGTPMSGRFDNSLSNTIGMFVNNIPLLQNINPDIKFSEFMYDVKNRVITNALNNGIYPYDMLTKTLKINSNASLFDVMFAYQSENTNLPKIQNKKIDLIYANTKTSKFNLSMEIIPNTNVLNLEYNTALFKEETINSFINHYLILLSNILSNVEAELSSLELLSDREKNKILNNFNNTKINYPKNKTIIQIFEEQVKKYPNNIAVKYKNEKITYNELNLKANYLANKFIEHGISKGDIIGVNLPRSIELIISIIASLKIGAIYMPMYVDYPRDRLEYMLQNSKAKLLICKNKNNLEFDGITENILSFKEMPKEKLVIKNAQLEPEDTIYVIYTSGSTGKPKGAQISNKNLVNFVYAFSNYYENKINSTDNFLACTNISFDVSIWEIFLPLLNGAKLTLYEEEIIHNIITYTDKIVKENITGMYIPPNILEEVYSILKERKNVKLTKLLVGVEPIKADILNQYYNLNKDLIIVNGYGPTETTICCTAHKFSKDEKTGIVPIGKPLCNNNIYILDSNLNIQPVGLPGEIYVTGPGVGKGYINKKAETDKNFIKNTFDTKSDMMYKTGDIAKWNADGTISFIGRNDSQIKISGHRIELNEINLSIMKYPNIIKSYTTIYQKGNKSYIVSYYISEKEISTTDLTTFLKNKLADYMIPNFMMQLDKFPLTPNGKIDKKQLPVNFKTNVEYVEPRNDFEQKLAKIYSDLFMLKKVGIDDNFFDLGGDSLTAIKFQVEALNLGLKLTYSDIFSYPTIRMLSENKNNKIKYKVDKNYNYDKINEIISKNNINQLLEDNKNTTSKINSVLLIGATGFLGIHILEKLLLSNVNKIYCIVRTKSSIDPETRLRKSMEFYLGDKYLDLIGNRIIVIDGDIIDAKLGQKSIKDYEYLGKHIDCVIDSAAIVKHYGNFKIFNDTNVEGTINVINFCKKFNKKLYYISTLSVSGNMMKEDENQETLYFKETDFYIGQDLNNIYIYTKFEAEKKIFEAMQDGLDACILRMGNITNRFSDGKFQINVSENAFVNRLKSIINLGIVQEKFLKHSLEFTPVDYCAEAIVKIINDNPKYTILHLFNDNFISINKLIEILNSINIHIQPVSDDEFRNNINTILKDKNLKNEINGIITDLNDDKLLNLINSVIPSSYFTKSYLKSLDFEWPLIENEYIRKYIEYFINIKYINI